MNMIELAKKAGFTVTGSRIESPYIGGSDISHRLAEFAALVVAHEREACAKVCDENAAKAEANGYTCKGETFIDGFGDGSCACAAAIRAMGEK